VPSILLAALLSQVSLASGKENRSIIVVGTVHNETDGYSVQTLCGILNRARPDLILVELDSSFFTPSLALKPEFATITLENRAVSDCQRSQAIPVRPYDIEGRNKIYAQHDYFKLQRDLSSALKDAEQKSLLGTDARILLEAITRFDDIARSFSSERPEIINSRSCDVAMESKHFYADDGMIRIVSSTPSLKQFSDFVKFKRDFWITRNDDMVKNIIAWIKSLRPRTVVVLCGFEHRYYLRESLLKRAADNAYDVKEYWED
jgi:hypothetical protein